MLHLCLCLYDCVRVCLCQPHKKKRRADFIPYRDSALTWLLRENLGKSPAFTRISHPHWFLIRSLFTGPCAWAPLEVKKIIPILNANKRYGNM